MNTLRERSEPPTGEAVRSATATQSSVEVLVKAIVHEADGVNSWEFLPVDAVPLPSFSAGAHIDLYLPNGLVRSYSLTRLSTDGSRYIVAINRDPNSRGGSSFIHDHLKAGDRIKISVPRNNFPLAEDAPHSVFVAGGIGITPIWSMIQRLERLNGSWELHYSARLERACAFRSDLIDLERTRSGRVHFNFDHEPGGAVTDLNAVISRASREAHLYCCGPTAMLRAFESAVKADGRPPERVHTEYFTAAEAKAVERHFTVVLARSGRSIEVPSGKTVLDALLDNNVDVPFSCMQGTCGTCETKVIEGIPDHRDALLTPGERASNQTMMICCSGSRSSKLVLDI